MEQTYLEIGTIVNTHGVRGELKLLPKDVDGSVLAACETFYVDGRAVRPRFPRVHKGCLLFRIDGVPDLDAALPYKGKVVSAAQTSLCRRGCTCRRSCWVWRCWTRRPARGWGSSGR